MSDLTPQERAEHYYSQYADMNGNAKPTHYLELYNQYFSGLMSRELEILELGVASGASLEYFAEMFPKSRVIGVDKTACPRKFSTDRIRAYLGSQDDPALFDRILKENDIRHFNIIIDDCSHIGSLTVNSFNLLFPLLVPEGFYVIEDWGTGYFR